jgi:hypothetical protein
VVTGSPLIGQSIVSDVALFACESTVEVLAHPTASRMTTKQNDLETFIASASFMHLSRPSMAFLANGRIEPNLHNSFLIVHFTFIFCLQAQTFPRL